MLRPLLALLTFGIFALATAAAEQVVVTQIEYSNDTISNGGRTAVCEIVLVALAPPDKRALNFQFLAFKGNLGWKITAGLVDWKTMHLIHGRVADGGFSSAQISERDFKKTLTPEGQLVGTLINAAMAPDFLKAFVTSPYSVRVRWEHASTDAVYYIAAPPDPKTLKTFKACFNSLGGA